MTSVAHMRAAAEPADRRTIVVAATFTAEPLEDAVRFWAAELDLPIDVRFAGYNQVFQQLLDPGSLMSRNASGSTSLQSGWRTGVWERSRAVDDLEKVEDFIAAAASAAERCGHRCWSLSARPQCRSKRRAGAA